MTVHSAVSAVKRDRKPATDLHDVLDAFRYLARTGGGWRRLPNDFPPWQTVYWWLRRFMRRFLCRTIHDVALTLTVTVREGQRAWSLVETPPRDRPSASVGPAPFCARSAVTGASHGAVDYVGRSIATNQFPQRFEHSLESALLDPTAIAPGHRDPLAVTGRKVAPLCTRVGHLHHAVEEPSIISGRRQHRPGSTISSAPINTQSASVMPIRSSNIPSRNWRRTNLAQPRQALSTSAGSHS